MSGLEKRIEFDAGAVALSGQLGKTVQRLRKAYNLSLSELAEQSGVAKSIISQIERNETNPTLATIWRLSQALDVSIERVLGSADDAPFIEKTTRVDTPVIFSDDGKCRLSVVGWLKTVEWLQWYDFRAEPGGVLESILGRAGFEVNSLHGQAVNRLADGLRVEARAPDGVVEAFSAAAAKGFNLCVQWHPEWQAADNAVSMRLLTAFGDACRQWKQRHS